MPTGSADQLVQFARDAADINSDEYRELSLQMCWDAVIHCAIKANAISVENGEQLKRIDWQEDFSRFVSHSDRLVRTRQDMRRVPAGAFLAFYRVESPDAYHRFVGDMRGKRRILHAMLSLGNGFAAGNKNSCIGIGHHVGWEILDLASDLHWLPRRKYSAINAYPAGIKKLLPLRIRYRELSRFQSANSTSHTKVLATGKTCIVSAGETWSVGPLADCVAIAAIRRATGSSRAKAQPKIFLWHVDGGWVSKTDTPSQAFQALQAFCAESPTDWFFVHGNGTQASYQGRKSFHQQNDLKALIEVTSFLPTGPGAKVQARKSYSGTELLINSEGLILNDNTLSPVDVASGRLMDADGRLLNDDGSALASDEDGNLAALVRMHLGAK